MLSNNGEHSRRNGKKSSNASSVNKKGGGLNLGGLLGGESGRGSRAGFQRVRTDEKEADLLDEDAVSSSSDDDDDLDRFSVPALRT